MAESRFFEQLAGSVGEEAAEWLGRLKRDWEAGRLHPPSEEDWVALAETDGSQTLQFSVVRNETELPLLTVTSSGDLHNEEFDPSGQLEQSLKQRYGGDGRVVHLNRLASDGEWFRQQFEQSLNSLAG